MYKLLRTYLHRTQWRSEGVNIFHSWDYWDPKILLRTTHRQNCWIKFLILKMYILCTDMASITHPPKNSHETQILEPYLTATDRIYTYFVPFKKIILLYTYLKSICKLIIIYIIVYTFIGTYLFIIINYFKFIQWFCRIYSCHCFNCIL